MWLPPIRTPSPGASSRIFGFAVPPGMFGIPLNEGSLAYLYGVVLFDVSTPTRSSSETIAHPLRTLELGPPGSWKQATLGPWDSWVTVQ